MSSSINSSSILSSSSSSSSVWWKDLISIGNISVEDPLVVNSRIAIGNGCTTPFWESCWIDDLTLKVRFPRLYSVSSLKRVAVACMGGWVDGIWKWGNFGVSTGEEAVPEVGSEMDLLSSLLLGREGPKEGRDKIKWSGTGDGVFSVASCYDFIAGFSYPRGPLNRFEGAKDLIWKIQVPFKIKAFGWRLLINRLPTKDLLAYRGVNLSIDNSFCAFCGVIPESCEHSFFKCDKAKLVWREIAVWIGKPENGAEEECLASFMDWYLFCKKKKVKEGKCGVIWLAILWIFWLTRNGFCFRNEGWVVDNTVWNIKSLLWKWSFCGEITHPIYSFYEFTKDPLLFLS
ncbi:uncharacterized protein LOC131658173 [Vicia villosa]|uniref:uncharacterized protein LOC131658173 n=1 Tax=Vicia villosa TaxID=3911 RepID=UPI00273B2C10|nr:uncharacterized protein LOC131658173 [Vicia villosa]